jgi:Flp pilus assembly protein TadB
MRYKVLVAALLAAITVVPSAIHAAKPSRREKTRSHKTSAKDRERKAEKKRQDRHAADMKEFERRWDAEQLEPELPESE